MPIQAIFGESQFKKAGYNALIVHGKSAAPVFIEIKNAEATFHDVAHLAIMEISQPGRPWMKPFTDPRSLKNHISSL